MTDDDELMSSLRQLAAQVDPVPDIVMDSGRAALLTRGLDAELADLLLDSSLESAQVRGESAQTRLLSFQFNEISLEVQVEYGDEQVSLSGLVDGASDAVEVDLERGDERHGLPVDDAGGFTARLPRGAARFRLRTRGRVITTSWVLL